MSSSKEINLEEYLATVNENITSKPRISKEMATDMLRRLYGLQVAEIKELNSFADQNFRVKVLKEHQNPFVNEVCPHGYTLKIINTLKSSMEGHFDSMHTAVEHLNEKGLRVPVPVKNLEGKTWQMENVPLLEKEGHEILYEKKCGIYLYTYIPGIPIAVIEYTAEILFEWGVLLAKFHKALEDLDCPHLRSKAILSNIKYIHLCDNFVGSLEEDQKDLVTAVLERYPVEVGERLDALPEGFIHGDFNDHNILAQSSSTDTYIADGILDFEDIHHGAYAWDLGLMLTHAALVPHWQDPLEAAGIALAGYRSVRTLTEQELDFLKISIECRICQTLVFCSYCAMLDPENVYISNLTNYEPKCDLLRLLSRTKNEDLLEKWECIFKQYCPS